MVVVIVERELSFSKYAWFLLVVEYLVRVFVLEGRMVPVYVPAHVPSFCFYQPRVLPSSDHAFALPRVTAATWCPATTEQKQRQSTQILKECDEPFY